MTKGQFDHIPMIDVAPLYGDDEAAVELLVQESRAILRDVGFAYIVGHPVPVSLIEAVRSESRTFFASPDEEKKAVAINDWHRGYMAPNSSVIVTSSVAKVSKPNQSESLLILHELPVDDPDVLAGKPLQGPNLWPSKQPSLRTTALEYVGQMQELGNHIATMLARCLDLPADHFKEYFERPTMFLRLLHYPPQAVEEGLFGSAPHTDYGFITLLAQDDVGGLEVRNKQGNWISAPPVPGSFVMNVGDMLSHWSGGLFASTPHRVINSSGKERYSQPFFYDPGMDTIITPVTGGEADPIRYGDYLMERLDKNYSYRHAVASAL